MTSSSIDWSQLARILSHLRIVHHVQGRLRVRLLPELLDIVSIEHSAASKAWLAQIPGVTNTHLNLAAASLVIQYDANQIQPQWWERLLVVSNQELPMLFAEIGVSN